MKLLRRLRSQKQERELERDAALIVGLDWLNQRPSRARENIARFIELLKQADMDSRSLRHTGASLEDHRDFPEKKRLLSILGRLTDILSAYKGTRVLWLKDDYEIEEFFALNARRLERDDKYYVETAIINYALELLRRGTVSHLRTCRECRKWFYAVSKHQKHCSEKCRQKYASHNELFKDRRREYMKKYRQEERDRDHRSRERVRRKH